MGGFIYQNQPSAMRRHTNDYTHVKLTHVIENIFKSKDGDTWRTEVKRNFYKPLQAAFCTIYMFFCILNSLLVLLYFWLKLLRYQRLMLETVYMECIAYPKYFSNLEK